MITVELKGFKKISRNITKAKAGAYKGTRLGVEQGINNIKKSADMYLQTHSNNIKWWGGGKSNVDRPSEGIRENWITYPEQGTYARGDEISKTLGNSSPHAHMVEFGTNSPITSVQGGKLVFWNGEKWISTWSVRGQPGKHYLQYGINMSKDWIVDNMGRLILSNWGFEKW